MRQLSVLHCGDEAIYVAALWQQTLKMAWPRTPLHAYDRFGFYHNDEDPGESEDSQIELDEDEGASRCSTHCYSKSPANESKAAFQPSYTYSEEQAQDELRADRRVARMRDALCFSLCVFCAVVVVSFIGLALSGSPTARAQTASLLQLVGRSPMVHFTITPKPHMVIEKYGKRREETTDFYGFTLIEGQLFPSTNLDQDGANRLELKGWIHVETNTSVKYDIVILDHRGLLMKRSVPKSRGTRCLTSRDIPPLHYLDSAADKAFEAHDWSSFRMNCSSTGTAPVETIFAHIPFVFCPGDLMVREYSPFPEQIVGPNVKTQSQTLWIHGERLLIEAVLISNREEAEQSEALEIWGNTSVDFIGRCPYLEAPLATYTPRSSELLRGLFGNTTRLDSGNGRGNQSKVNRD